MKTLVEQMKATPQGPYQTVWDHGISVKNYYFDLVNHLRDGVPLKYEWKLPEFLTSNRKKILDGLQSDSEMFLYTIFHDCGKPKCIQSDEKS